MLEMTELQIERRKSKRRAVPKRAIAVSSICICQILEISNGGCSLKFIDKDNSFGSETAIDIIYKYTSINGVPIRITWQKEPAPLTSSALRLKVAGVQFGILSRHQKTILTDFIKKYSLPLDNAALTGACP